MPETNISNAAYGNLKNTGTDYSVDAVSTDGVGDQKETEFQNNNFNIQLGYYKKIPELKVSIDAAATWTVGKGFQADPETTFVLQSIRGHGKDTFNTILENMIRTSKIGGDAYAEIIRNPEGRFVNLKVLDPGTIKIIANRKGLIIRYEQLGKVKGTKKTFKPENIFHLSRNRVADEIHGESLIDAVEWIILARNEAMDDMKQLMHRHVKPRIVFQLDTDIESKITAFKIKADKASDQGENLYIPKGAVEWDLLSVPSNSTLNPLPWIDRLNQYFFQATGVPQIIVGGAQEITEASAKIAYLAWEQTIEEEQLYIEEQAGMQLGVTIELEFPATLQNEMLSDSSKSETMQASTPEDTGITNVGLEGGAV